MQLKRATPLPQSSDPVVRRSTRLLHAVHELHKQGYQNLAVCCGMSPIGGHWQCIFTTFNNLVITDGSVEIVNDSQFEQLNHSSAGSGNQYFGWTDATQDSARQLAKRIKSRAPDLLKHAEGVNFNYAGWFTHMLGHVEAGALPVMYQDYSATLKGHIETTRQNTRILMPPHPTTWSKFGKTYFYSDPPHLLKDQDWHTAYSSIVDAWRSSKFRSLPKYPIDLEDHLFEIGAYWEGAIYYLQHVLNFTRIDDYLDALERENTTSERWYTFLQTWNDVGQLKFLNAFLVRHMLIDNQKYPLTASNRQEWEHWLAQFERTNHEQGQKMDNPFFGGLNPLHLGMIIQGMDERIVKC